MSGRADGDVVIVGMMAEPSLESVVPGMAMTATTFVVVAMMMVMTGRYGLRAPAMVTNGVASLPGT